MLVATSAQAAPGVGFHVIHYAVALRPDAVASAVSGTETVVAAAANDGATALTFSPNALTITGATIDGRRNHVTSTKDGITFSLPHALTRGQKVTLRFRISGKPARGVTTSGGGSIPAISPATGWSASRTRRATRPI